MEKLPIGELWGIGRRLSKRLMAKGVYTAADFYRLPLIRVRGSLGVNGERSWRELHGTPCIELKHTERDLQDSISETRTFPKDIEDYDYIRTRMSYTPPTAHAGSGRCRDNAPQSLYSFVPTDSTPKTAITGRRQP